MTKQNNKHHKGVPRKILEKIFTRGKMRNIVVGIRNREIAESQNDSGYNKVINLDLQSKNVNIRGLGEVDNCKLNSELIGEVNLRY